MPLREVGRNAEQVAERANLGHRRRTLSGEELRYSRFSTENGRELRTGHLVLAEHEIDHTYRRACNFSRERSGVGAVRLASRFAFAHGLDCLELDEVLQILLPPHRSLGRDERLQRE